jgi:uncharacterized protein YbjT (DUF2867 family)
MNRRGTVLLLGATGFIGRRLLEVLLDAGYDVVCGVRDASAVSRGRAVAVDFMHDHDEADWLPRLAGIDYVINAVGILRESRRATFDALHVAAPVALFRASARAGVRKIVQISALGADEAAVSRYHVSKKRADDALSALAVPWVIVQPSLVFGVGGESAALFMRLAALPVIPVPGDGSQQVQPVHIDDLTAAILRLLISDDHDRRRIAAVGPKAVSLRDFLAGLRSALALGRATFLRVPMTFVRIAAAAGDRLEGGLLDRESLGMLVRGNVASAGPFSEVLGRTPRAVDRFIAPVAARALANEARLGWLLPVLRYSVAFVWIATAVVSLGLYPVEDSYALLARTALTGTVATLALYGAALLDLVFGMGILVMRRRRRLWRAQMLVIVGYTVIITFCLPEYWLHPYGPLTKNLPMLAAILMLHELDEA